MSRCSEMNETFPYMWPGWSAEKVADRCVVIRRGGSAARISNGTRPQDPGGGEAQLTSSWDMAMVRPVLQPTSQPIVLRSNEVGVSAMSVHATRRRVDRTV